MMGNREKEEENSKKDSSGVPQFVGQNRSSSFEDNADNKKKAASETEDISDKNIEDIGEDFALTKTQSAFNKQNNEWNQEYDWQSSRWWSATYGYEGSSFLSTSQCNRSSNSNIHFPGSLINKKTIGNCDSNPPLFNQNSYQNPLISRPTILPSRVYDNPFPSRSVSPLLYTPGQINIKKESIIEFTSSLDDCLDQLDSVTEEEKESGNVVLDCPADSNSNISLESTLITPDELVNIKVIKELLKKRDEIDDEFDWIINEFKSLFLPIKKSVEFFRKCFSDLSNAIEVGHNDKNKINSLETNFSEGLVNLKESIRNFCSVKSTIALILSRKNFEDILSAYKKESKENFFFSNFNFFREAIEERVDCVFIKTKAEIEYSLNDNFLGKFEQLRSLNNNIDTKEIGKGIILPGQCWNLFCFISLFSEAHWPWYAIIELLKNCKESCKESFDNFIEEIKTNFIIFSTEEQRDIIFELEEKNKQLEGELNTEKKISKTKSEKKDEEILKLTRELNNKKKSCHEFLGMEFSTSAAVVSLVITVVALLLSFIVHFLFFGNSTKSSSKMLGKKQKK